MEIFSHAKETNFFVVIKKNDLRLHRHYTEEDAIAEAKRLAVKNKDTFFILETIEAHKNIPTTMQVGLQELGYEPNEVAFFRPRCSIK
jgi:hypothetical protein